MITYWQALEISAGLSFFISWLAVSMFGIALYDEGYKWPMLGAASLILCVATFLYALGAFWVQMGGAR